MPAPRTWCGSACSRYARRCGFIGLAILGLVFSLMTLAWFAAYALAIARIGRWLGRPAFRRTLEGATGVALVGLGVKLATDKT